MSGIPWLNGGYMCVFCPSQSKWDLPARFLLSGKCKYRTSYRQAEPSDSTQLSQRCWKDSYYPWSRECLISIVCTPGLCIPVKRRWSSTCVGGHLFILCPLQCWSPRGTVATQTFCRGVQHTNSLRLSSLRRHNLDFLVKSAKHWGCLLSLKMCTSFLKDPMLDNTWESENFMLIICGSRKKILNVIHQLVGKSPVYRGKWKKPKIHYDVLKILRGWYEKQ